jgi:WD40 repeat protein/tRNA A-37 threonylcarbamoyl transferase component Bud32
VPGFEILEELGRGGMGVVYKARQLRPKRLVALKMLLSGRYARPVDRARFEGETEALADLQHPNIVPVYEVGDVDGLPYFAMEYVEGGSLAQSLKGLPSGERLPPREAARLVETLARAVQAAHQRGIIHRDLKPANILLQRRPTTDSTDNDQNSDSLSVLSVLSVVDCLPKLTDFGLAKRLNHKEDLTPSRAVMGTFAYMAPEQAEGKVKEVGTPADIYALGGILYELLTSRPPVDATSDVEAIRKLLHEDPTPPRRLNPAVPRDLETICQRCLQKEPAKRYSSAAALADDLRRYLDGEPVQARRAGWLERAGQWVRRRPARAGLALTSAVAVLALVGVAVSLFYSEQLKDANADLDKVHRKVQQANQELNQTYEEVKTQKARADHFLYLARMKQVHRAWLDGNLPLAEELLTAQVPQAGQKDFRGFEWDYLRALTGKAGRVLGQHAGGASAVAFSLDGKRLASAGADGKVLLWAGDDFAQRRELTTSKRPAPALCVAFTPGGRRLAAGREDGSVAIWDTDSGKLVQVLRDHSGRVYSLAYSPTGERLVSVDDRGMALVRNTTEVDAPVMHVFSNVPFCAIAFIGSDRFLLAGGEARVGRTMKPSPVLTGGGPATPAKAAGGTVRQFDAENQVEVELTPQIEEPQLLHGLSAVRKGKRTLFATAGYDHTVKIWDLNAKRPPLILNGHSVEVLAVAFAPDGARVASASWDRTVRIWNASTGRELRVLRGHTDVVRGVAFHKDGRRLASVSDDGTVRLWDADSDQEATVRRGGKGGVRALACSPDGALLAWGGDDGRVRVWDTQGRGQTEASARGGAVQGLAFSSRGDRLVAASENGMLTIWAVARDEAKPALRLLAEKQGDGRAALGLAFRPTGRVLAVAYGAEQGAGGGVKVREQNRLKSGKPDGDPRGPGEIVLWDEHGEEPLQRIAAHDGELNGFAFSPDGSRLVTCGSTRDAGTNRLHGEIKVWDADSGTLLRTLKGHTGPVLSVAVSPDGSTLASGGYDYTVRLWSAADGSPLHTLPGHVCLVHSLAFNRDGTRLASGSEDWGVKVWDVQLGAEALDLRGHADRVRAVAFSPDGRRLYSAGGDGSLRVWEAPRRR